MYVYINVFLTCVFVVSCCSCVIMCNYVLLAGKWASKVKRLDINNIQLLSGSCEEGDEVLLCPHVPIRCRLATSRVSKCQRF